MTTATILLNVGLAAGLSLLVAAAMAVVPNLDRIRFRARRHQLMGSDAREQKPAYAAAIQAESNTAV
jgi:hypothetical protein